MKILSAAVTESLTQAILSRKDNVCVNSHRIQIQGMFLGQLNSKTQVSHLPQPLWLLSVFLFLLPETTIGEKDIQGKEISKQSRLMHFESQKGRLVFLREALPRTAR